MASKSIWQSWCDKEDLFCDFPHRHGANLCVHLSYLWRHGNDVFRYVLGKVTGKDPGPVTVNCPCPPKKYKCTCQSGAATPSAPSAMLLDQGNADLDYEL